MINFDDLSLVNVDTLCWRRTFIAQIKVGLLCKFRFEMNWKNFLGVLPECDSYLIHMFMI